MRGLGFCVSTGPLRRRLSSSTVCAAMKTKTLGSSDIEVTECCLGTMTFGVQVSEEDTMKMLDYAVKERGVNFLDTAEMYPVPSTDPSWVPGRSEDYIGLWLQKNPGLREKVVIATKVSGFNPASATVGNRFVPSKGKLDGRLDRDSILAACDGSLRRLQTDYIDLYQVHWPDRYKPLFGPPHYKLSQERKDSVPIRETVAAMGELISAGKIKAWGLGNDSTFGVCAAIKACDELGVPRPATIQNHWSLFDRTFENELLEACSPLNYNIGLLPYSVLCGGTLSGKYLSGETPEGSRYAKYPRFMSRYNSQPCQKVARQVQELAGKLGMSMSELIHAWCKSKPFIPSTIIGVTSMEQLKQNIDGFDIELSKESLDEMEKIYLAQPEAVHVQL